MIRWRGDGSRHLDVCVSDFLTFYHFVFTSSKIWLSSFIWSSFLSLTEHLSSRTVITFLLNSRQESKQCKTELQTGDEEMPRSDWLFGEIRWRVCAGRKTRPQGKHACLLIILSLSFSLSGEGEELQYVMLGLWLSLFAENICTLSCTESSKLLCFFGGIG